ncbi:MAG: ABC transporter substrate-binding protein [Lachnospiraceae bacterium]|nr:ABC transporter substrate-binding protein [Lachnospiraceae bacterium]
MKRVVLLIACVCALTLPVALCGCGGDKAEKSSQIVVGIAQDLEDSLDPHKAVAAGTKEVLFNVYEGLLKPDSRGNLIPAVAESYEVSDDGMAYTFHLRNGVTFHNGNKVTAEDVKYSLLKIAGKTGDTPMIPAYALIDEVTVEDAQTVCISLSEADVDFPAYLAMVNAAIIPADNTTPDTVPIGTGPFCLTSRTVQDNILLTRYEDYWGTKAYLSQVKFRIVPEIDTVVMNLRGGSLDMYAHLTTDQVAQLGNDFQILEGTMNLVQALYLNNAVKPLDDVRVRQALCYAVDRKNILELTSEGKGTIIGSSMFPAFSKYYMPELSRYYTRDIPKAKELLKQAGYPDGFSLTITVPSNYQPHINTAQVIVEQLKDIGVNADIKLVEWNTWLSDTYMGRNYESTVIGVDASYLTGRALLERFYSKADDNFTNFSDPAYDALYEKVITLTDEDEKTDCYKAMEEILTKDAANVYIQDMAEFVALRNNYEGYEFYPLYVLDMSKIKPVQAE